MVVVVMVDWVDSEEVWEGEDGSRRPLWIDRASASSLPTFTNGTTAKTWDIGKIDSCLDDNERAWHVKAREVSLCETTRKGDEKRAPR